MSVTFKDLKMEAEKIKNESKQKTITVEVNGSNEIINIKQHISSLTIESKIEEIISASFMKGRFSPVLHTIATQLAVISMFTDIRFTAGEKMKVYNIYDTIETLGLYQKIIEAIDFDEYTNFMKLLKESVEHEVKYRKSFASVIETFVRESPRMGKAAAESLKNFDEKDLTTLMEMYNRAKEGNSSI